MAWHALGWCGLVWDSCGIVEQDLITRLLNPNTNTRFTTRDILQHPWIRKKQVSGNAASVVIGLPGGVDGSPTRHAISRTFASADQRTVSVT